VVADEVGGEADRSSVTSSLLENQKIGYRAVFSDSCGMSGDWKDAAGIVG
jgi:hypothetical protein